MKQPPPKRPSLGPDRFVRDPGGDLLGLAVVAVVALVVYMFVIILRNI
jgi:hypothetical protein